MFCKLCCMSFFNRKNRKKHRRKEHKKSNCVCPFCSFTCMVKKELVIHLRKNHNFEKKRKSRLLCPLCDFYVPDYSSLDNHLLKVHGLGVEKECLKFENISQFEIWKLGVEKEMRSQYIARRQIENSKCQRSEFVCVYSNEERGSTLRSNGSNKIGRVCPSRMIVKIFPEKVKVLLNRHHVGHCSEVLCKKLPVDERAEVFENLSQSIDNEIFQKEEIYNIIRDVHKFAAKNEASVQSEENNESQADQIQETIDPTDTYLKPYDKKLPSNTEKVKAKLEALLRMVITTSKCDEKIVLKMLNEVAVYVRNGTKTRIENPNRNFIPQRDPRLWKSHKKNSRNVSCMKKW